MWGGPYLNAAYGSGRLGLFFGGFLSFFSFFLLVAFLWLLLSVTPLVLLAVLAASSGNTVADSGSNEVDDNTAPANDGHAAMFGPSGIECGGGYVSCTPIEVDPGGALPSASGSAWGFCEAALDVRSGAMTTIVEASWCSTSDL